MVNMRQGFSLRMVLFLALIAFCFGQPSYKRTADMSTQAFQSLFQLILAILER